MKNLFAAAVIFAASLANACAGNLDARISALAKATQGKEFVMMDVHCASNFISNKLMVAALKGGTESTDAQKITAMLQRPEPAGLAISGENDSVAAATLERALDMLQGKTLTPQEVIYIGARQSGEALSAKAATLGLALTVVPFE
jgi:hypothetical protein